MKKYKICVYAIAKNEEKFVDRWMDSVSEADLVVVLDTGSTDKTVEKLLARGAKVYQDKIEPWRFDTARNIAMSHIPEDYDICVSNDIDEVFIPNWREKLENAWNENTTKARYLFTWSYHEDGTPNKQFSMEKIHARKDYQWIHPVHEILKYNGKKEKIIFIKDLILNHYPDQDKPRSQYLPLLELSAKENPNDSQTIFWLGREYYYYKMYHQSIQTLQKYLNLPNSTWLEERGAAMRFIGDCYLNLAQNNNALIWYYKAIAEAPDIRESYLNITYLGYQTSNWELVYLMVKRALNIQNKTGSYLVDNRAWNETFFDQGAIACFNLGMYTEAEEYAKKAIEINPNNERLKNNLYLIQNKIMNI